MTTLLITLIFLLADGTPAKYADIRCSGISVFIAGDDGSRHTGEGSPLIIDSRGAIVLNVQSPMTIGCEARQGAEAWRGNVALTRAQKVIVMSLEEE